MCAMPEPSACLNPVEWALRLGQDAQQTQQHLKILQVRSGTPVRDRDSEVPMTHFVYTGVVVGVDGQRLRRGEPARAFRILIWLG